MQGRCKAAPTVGARQPGRHGWGAAGGPLPPTPRCLLAEQIRLDARLESCWSGGVGWISTFTGRADELSRLSQGVRNGSTTLVVGDPGMGKTRLAAECAGEFEADGWLVVSAPCQPLAEQLPLLPVVDGLRQLQSLEQGALLQDCLRECPPYVSEDLARLVPELTSGSSGAAPGEAARQRLFAAVLQCWTAVSRRQRLLITMEDLHWSDGATRDFLTYLSAQRAAGSVPVVLTTRPVDNLDEGVAAAWLGTMVSTGRWQRIHLTPLAPDEVEVMAASVAPYPLSADQVAALVRRSEGNPFFVEQLLAGSAVTTLSEDLAELLRSRAAATTSEAHDVLRVLAVAGRPLSDDELSAVTRHGADRVRGALRELLGAALARQTVDGRCTPRHALLGEAVEADLFAGERAELHGAVAGLLIDRADSSLAAEAAYHLRRAGRERDELPVRIMAAEYCEQVRGHAEAALHWSRAVDLAEELDDGHVAALALRGLGAAGRGGFADRFLDYVERGKRAAVRHGQRQLHATLMAIAAGIHSPDISLERGLTELHAAVDEFRELPPSAEQVEALIVLYWLHRAAGKPTEALPHLRLAVEIADALGKNSVMALATLAQALLSDGEVGSGLAALAEARHRVEPDADLGTVVRLALAETDTSLKLNRLEEGATDGLAAWNRLRENGIANTYMATGVLSNACEALRGRGKIDQLRRIVEPLTTDQEVEPTTWMMHEQRCWADLCAGLLGPATDRLSHVLIRSRQLSFEEKAELAELRLEVALWGNDPQAAVDVARQAVEGMAGVEPDGWAARLLTTAMWACADLVEDARARRDDANLRAGLRISEQLQAAHADLLRDPFAEHPYFVTATAEGREWTAELNRCQGDSQPEAWLAVARQWEAFRRPHRASYAWWRAAQALLQLGQRGPAAGALQTAHQRSDQHVPLTDAVTHLARMARVSLRAPSTAPTTPDHGPGASPPRHGLTSRELDVLRLLSAGLTNAEIGARLYMSPKTASVHVTAILRKLQATNRVHAAAIAERLGLNTKDTTAVPAAVPSRVRHSPPTKTAGS